MICVDEGRIMYNGTGEEILHDLHVAMHAMSKKLMEYGAESLCDTLCIVIQTYINFVKSNDLDIEKTVFISLMEKYFEMCEEERINEN